MSKGVNSPTARLLQSSRLFSLPRSLPQPSLELVSSTGNFRASNTATLPYPTHQAVATTLPSHFRGDWGLKRSLPARANRGLKTPHIRISSQDTPEQITDFSSATDHTKTSIKWRELGLPVLRRAPQGSPLSSVQPCSAFDTSVDNTNPKASATSPVNGYSLPASAATRKRWKFAGPWIAGMQDGEFETYLLRVVDSRRDEWRTFIRDRAVQKLLPEARRKATHEGEVLGVEQLQRIEKQVVITELELDSALKILRDEHTAAYGIMSSELTSMIFEFLDLPGTAIVNESASRVRRAFLDMGNADASTTAPPSTHPSAGLSYLRTGAIMENHPLHGPQAYRTPQLARVVRPRSGALGSEAQAKLGVAGVVAHDPVSSSYSNTQFISAQPGGYDANLLTSKLDLKANGGNKIWVHPQDATIDENGRIRLSVSRGDREAIAVRTGSVQPIHQARRHASTNKSTSPLLGAL